VCYSGRYEQYQRENSNVDNVIEVDINNSGQQGGQSYIRVIPLKPPGPTKVHLIFIRHDVIIESSIRNLCIS